jgi:hypothetical protein
MMISREEIKERGQDLTHLLPLHLNDLDIAHQVLAHHHPPGIQDQSLHQSLSLGNIKRIAIIETMIRKEIKNIMTKWMINKRSRLWINQAMNIG